MITEQSNYPTNINPYNGKNNNTVHKLKID